MRLCRMRVRLCRRGTLGVGVLPTAPLAALARRLRDRLLPPSTATTTPVQPGLHHFSYHQDGEESRIHLRVEADGSGVLLVNASRVLHFNPSAAMMALLALRGVPQQQAIQELRNAFEVSRARASNDYTQMTEQLAQLVRPDSACAIHDLELDILAPFSARPSAPYRMDLALTYRCNNDCPHCYNARERTFPGLDQNGWQHILDQIWNLAIPHVVFTGGEPTLIPYLPNLVAYAQNLGMVTGLNTNGRRLSDPAYVQALLEAGLDHVQITLESHDPAIHDAMVNSPGAWKQTTAGIRNALQARTASGRRLYVMTNTTMLRNNSPSMAQTLDFLAQLGLPTIGLNALIYAGHGAQVGSGLPEADLVPLLTLARQKTDANGQRLIWYTPTQYCHFDPMQMELGVKGCTAALYNMCVEPNGDVLPCQSYYHSLGNLLNDPWDSIWNHDLAVAIRERRYVADHCRDCALLMECGGGCPLAAQAPVQLDLPNSLAQGAD
jgi:radical SAM protein with 4Fe4S-binding SPASM domain